MMKIKNLQKISDELYSINEWLEYPETQLESLNDTSDDDTLFFINKNQPDVVVIFKIQDSYDLFEGLQFSDEIKNSITDNYVFKFVKFVNDNTVVIDDLNFIIKLQESFKIDDDLSININEKIWEIYKKI